MTFVNDELKTFFSNLTQPNVLTFLEAMKMMGVRRNIPNISWETARFMIQTLQKRTVSHILEIGPANGFSTIMLALACPHARISSVECSRHAFEELRHNIRSFSLLQQGHELLYPAELWPKVTSNICQENISNFSLFYADARELLPAFLHGVWELGCTNPVSILRDIPERQFDCIFIDGAFRMTREFFDLSLPLLSPGGLIILDDAIKYRWKMEGFHEYLEGQGIGHSLVQTDADDGVMVIDFWNNLRKPT